MKGSSPVFFLFVLAATAVLGIPIPKPLTLDSAITVVPPDEVIARIYEIVRLGRFPGGGPA